MNTAISLAKELQSMKATDVIRNERVRNQFIAVYNSVWKEGGEEAYEREALYFNQQLREKETLRACTGTSIFYSFIELATRGLSLAPGTQALCYLLPRSTKVGVDQNGKTIWEKACRLTISGYGELTLRKAMGQIAHADNPVIVYEGDKFEWGENNGRKVVNYMSSVPRKSNRIIACFVKITRTNGTVDYSVMTEIDWKRLEEYSAKNNSYFEKTGQRVEKANELYSSNGGQIDTGFLIAKCIKHAFKTYPKLNIGRGAVLESEIKDEPQPSEPRFEPYDTVAEGTVEDMPTDFCNTHDLSQGVVVEQVNDNDDTF